MLTKAWVLEVKLPNGSPAYLTEHAPTGNAALIADAYFAIHFTQERFALEHLQRCKDKAPAEVKPLIDGLVAFEMEFDFT